MSPLRNGFDSFVPHSSSQGHDGYPRRLFDKRTGEIDPEVAGKITGGCRG